jgi:predicted Zn-dependent protease
MPYSANPASVSPARRVLARDHAIDVGKKLLTLVRPDVVGVHIEHTTRAVAKVANGRLRGTDDGDRVNISFQSLLGSGISCSIETNQFTDTTLTRIATQVEAMAPKLASDEIETVDPNDKEYFTYNAREHQPVKLWYESTAGAMDTARGDAIPKIIDQIKAAGLSGAATVGLSARSVLHLYRYGLVAFGEETDCEITVTARTPDYTGSGWAGQGSRDWTVLDPTAVTTRAIELAKRSQRPVALEPGRRTAILGPAAVAQLIRRTVKYFDQESAYRRGASWSPFTNLNAKPGERQTLLGQRVFDRRLMFIADPTDPLGGFPPFYEKGGVENFGVRGYPNVAMTFIDKGVLANFANKVGNAVASERTPCDIPRSVRVTTAPGETTATIEEMIANCKEGVYVNRFSDIDTLNESREAQNTGMMTGVTRDGCFLIKNGKIEKPIKNFRFMESPFYVLNRVEMIGVPERVAFGYNNQPNDYEDFVRWPRFPVIVPPMMIRDFNFVALADAV